MAGEVKGSGRKKNAPGPERPGAPEVRAARGTMPAATKRQRSDARAVAAFMEAHGLTAEQVAAIATGLLDAVGAGRDAERRGKRHTPPAAARLRQGKRTTQTAVAARLGICQTATSKMLGGWQAPHPRLGEVLGEMIGDDAAAEVMSLAAASRAEILGKRTPRQRPLTNRRGEAAKLLNAAGLTQQDIAAPLGVNTSTVSYWLSGGRSAPVAVADLLRHRLGHARARPIIDAVPVWREDPNGPRVPSTRGGA